MATRTDLEQVKAVIVQTSKDLQTLKESDARHDEILGTFTERVDAVAAELARVTQSMGEMDGIVKKVKKKSVDTSKQLKSIYHLFDEYRVLIISDLSYCALLTLFH